VIHLGDFVDGIDVYRGQVYELFIHGAQSQTDYAIKYYPKHKNITTYVLGGNHDYSFIKKSNTDIFRDIVQERHDIVFMGYHSRFVKFGPISMYLVHGDGAANNSRLKRTMDKITQKVDMVLVGHYHIFNYLPMYRGMIGWQLGCFQAQTPYLKRRSYFPEVGGIILTIHKGKKGSIRIIHELIPYYKMIKHDY